MMVRKDADPTASPSPVDDLDFIGGELCLDFVNTASERQPGPLRERLQEYGDLVRWAERTESVDGRTASRLRAAARRDTAAAVRSLERGRAVRDAIYRVFRALHRGEAASAADVALLSEAGAEATSSQVLVAGESGFELDWPETEVLDRAWWPAATSAVALLLSADVPRVKECATDSCNWMFLDLSRNRSRRWCDMKECGNRAKARRHYARRRQG
jgi:predicted RNA-binding Zn ribbon-like protein